MKALAADGRGDLMVHVAAGARRGRRLVAQVVVVMVQARVVILLVPVVVVLVLEGHGCLGRRQPRLVGHVVGVVVMVADEARERPGQDVVDRVGAWPVMGQPEARRRRRRAAANVGDGGQGGRRGRGLTGLLLARGGR